MSLEDIALQGLQHLGFFGVCLGPGKRRSQVDRHGSLLDLI
jgi:hypothetical protein